jgi:excisionase family DNA binding protein
MSLIAADQPATAGLGAAQTLVRSPMNVVVEVEKPPLLTVKEAARLASVSPRTIHRWVAEGRLTFSKKYGRTKIFRASLLEAA